MAIRSTHADIARESGVSAATVDRVLNNRAGVRPRTREMVLEAARKLDYISATSEGTPVAEAGSIPLDFVLPMGTNAFIESLQHSIESQGADRPELDVCVHMIKGFDPDTLAQKLSDLRPETRGVGVIALDHPIVREAIRKLAANGTKIVTLASDISRVPRIAYIGIDNRQGGRLAGYVLGRFLGASRPMKVALLAGSLAYRGHEEREMGFLHVLEEDFPNLQVVALREILDDRERAYEETTKLLGRYQDLAAIYNVGAGNTGVARALKTQNRDRSVVFIAHEATESNKALLLDGTIDALIDQNPRVEAREALNLLTKSIQDIPYELHGPRLSIIFRENIPD